MIALIGILACSLFVLFGLFAVRGALRKRSNDRVRARPPVTVLKPLCGVDPHLEANLESFFVQDYAGPTQIVFGIRDSSDPAIAIAERVARRHPEIDCTVVIGEHAPGLNPKISNLRSMVKHAKHELILISDSNVLAPPEYLREAIDTLLSNERIGLVTHLFAGTGERTLGAALENVQLNGFVAAGVALPTWIGDAAVVGKSMLFSRARFESLGGFESVRDLLAEDFIIGKQFQHAGYEVAIAPTVISAVNGEISFTDCWRRQLRWSMLRLRLRGLAFLLEPVTSPLIMMPFAMELFGAARGLCWALSMMMLRDVGQWLLLRGRERWWIPLLLSPLRELSMLAVWIATPFVKHVSWRGHRVRIGAGTHGFRTAPLPR